MSLYCSHCSASTSYILKSFPSAEGLFCGLWDKPFWKAQYSQALLFTGHSPSQRGRFLEVSKVPSWWHLPDRGALEATNKVLVLKHTNVTDLGTQRSGQPGLQWPWDGAQDTEATQQKTAASPGLQESQFQPLQRPAWNKPMRHGPRKAGLLGEHAPAPLPPSSSMVHAEKQEASKGGRKIKMQKDKKKKKEKHLTLESETGTGRISRHCLSLQRWGLESQS